MRDCCHQPLLCCLFRCADGSGEGEEGAPVAALQSELEGMRSAESGLDSQLASLWGAMRRMTDHALNRQRLYVTDSDVMALPPMRASDQVVAVLAPQGTTLEVPEPEAGLAQGARRYRFVSRRTCWVLFKTLQDLLICLLICMLPVPLLLLHVGSRLPT